MTLFRRILLFCAALLALAGIAYAQGPGAKPAQPNFGSTQNVLELKTTLTPYHAPGNPSGTEADGSRWYMLQVSNDSVRPATRVLIAGQPPRSVLHILPLKTRPAILALASSDSGTVVETATAYGRRAWRVIVPPVTTVGIALRVGSAEDPPALYAWTEPALASHNRQLAIFITAVASLIGASAAWPF